MRACSRPVFVRICFFRDGGRGEFYLAHDPLGEREPATSGAAAVASTITIHMCFFFGVSNWCLIPFSIPRT